MIFRQIREIVTGTKTQTRRIIKPGEVFVPHENGHVVLTPGGRVKWRVGQDYAVIPKRGKRGIWYNPRTFETYEIEDDNHKIHLYARKCLPLRIKILYLRRNPLRSIHRLDAIVEGVGSIVDYAVLWNSINGPCSWDDNPFVWVIDFEVLAAIKDI